MEKGTSRCNGRKSCQICPIVVEGDTFGNFNESRSFTNFSGPYNCNSQNVVYLLQCNICNKKYVGSTTTSFDNGLMSISPIIAHMPANTMMAALTGVNQSHRPTFLLIFRRGSSGCIFG